MIDTSPEIVCSADDRPTWLAARRAFVGASESYPIVQGEPLYDVSAADVYNRKVGIDDEVDLSGVERIQLGLRLEPFAAELFADETGLKIERCGAMLEIPGARVSCTPDYWALEPDGERVPLELKTSGLAGPWEESVPKHVWHQVQHQLAVTGAPHGYAGALCGGFQGFCFRWGKVPRDETYIRALLERLAEFWQAVDDLEGPPIDGSAACRQALGRLYPRATPGSTKLLPSRFMELDEEYQQIELQLKPLQTRREAIRNEIRAAIGEAETGIVSSEVQWTNRSGARGRALTRKGD